MLLILPADMVALLAPCAPLFSRPVWRHVQTVLVARRGPSAAPASARSARPCALWAVGRRHVRPFQADHRVLHRALWSSRRASRILLGLLVAPFVPPGPLVLGIEETTLAPPRQAERGGWHLARPRALEPPPCRAGAWAALGRPPAARARAVGNAGLGLALSDCARLLPSARPSGSAAGTNP